MIVTVNDYLNGRVGTPSVNAPSYQYLSPGSTLEVEDVLYTGSYFEGSNQWLKDKAGNYYWAAATNYRKRTGNYQDWMLELRIDKIWPYATGKNVGVAIVDTGVVSQNSDLTYNQNRYSFEDNAAVQDTNGHGTHCAGIIASKNKKNVVGVAPESNLFVCKIATGGSMTEQQTTRYADAINWCASRDDIQVISISWGSFIRDQSLLDQIQKAVDNATAKGKVIVCAMGDASQFNDPGPIYPVCLKNTIGVGSIPVENFLYPYINDSLTLLTIGSNIPSYGLHNEIVQMSGTSQSNAIVAGLVTLLIEKKKFKRTTHADIKTDLLSACKIQNIKGLKLSVLDAELLLNLFQS